MPHITERQLTPIDPRIRCHSCRGVLLQLGRTPVHEAYDVDQVIAPQLGHDMYRQGTASVRLCEADVIPLEAES